MTAPARARPSLWRPARVERVVGGFSLCHQKRWRCVDTALVMQTKVYGTVAEMSNELLVLVTAPSRDDAARIANALVEERLAACVNIVAAIESVYRWEGRVTTDREALLIIKTTAARYQQIEQRVKELHTYETPEVIAIKIDRGSSDYLSWLSDSVS